MVKNILFAGRVSSLWRHVASKVSWFVIAQADCDLNKRVIRTRKRQKFVHSFT